MRFLFFLIFVTFFSFSQSTNKVDIYIEKYKDLAIEHMVEYGIPASITLSQGILESKYGDFELTKLNDDKWEPLIVYQMTYEFKDGNRRIYLSCSDILDGDYSLYLSYSDSKLRKQADEEEEKMISDSTPDYDI